ncbi:MAG: aminotransferase class IV [Trueperaceae bacterium]|nr:aminotransferase class IV [Trueperaceae bacterium]
MFEFHSINGQLLSKSEARLDVHDIGFRRGYAAFDYLKVLNGQAIFLEDHLDRFEASARKLHLKSRWTRAELERQILELIRKNEAKEAGLQLFLTGGIAADGFTPDEAQLILIMTVLPKPKPEAYKQGFKLMTYQYQRDLPDVKSNNYLMAVYLSEAMKEAGASDVLYHDGKRVLETTRSNIFVVKDGVVATPDKDILPGITRKQLLKFIPSLAKLELREVKLEELWNAEEIFISSTTKGAMPVTQIDSQVIATGKPGQFSEKIAEAYQQHLESYMAVGATD